MKKLSDNLKRILNGLAHQHAAEYLSTHDKMTTLGVASDTRKKKIQPTLKVVNKQSKRRVAFISNGGGAGAPIDYAINTCSQQAAKIDILIHGTTGKEKLSALITQLRVAGIEHQVIRLGLNSTDEIINYIRDNSSLILLVSTPDDEVANNLIKKSAVNRQSRVLVPIVLIEERLPDRETEQTAA